MIRADFGSQDSWTAPHSEENNQLNMQIGGLKCTNTSGMNSWEQGAISRQVLGGTGAWPGEPYGLCQGWDSRHTLYIVERHGQEDLHLDAFGNCRYLTHNWEKVEKPYANKDCLLRKQEQILLPPKASTLVNPMPYGHMNSWPWPQKWKMWPSQLPTLGWTSQSPVLHRHLLTYFQHVNTRAIPRLTDNDGTEAFFKL